MEISSEQIKSRVEYFRRIIDVRVISELKTIIDVFSSKIKENKSFSKSKISNKNYEKSFFEGFVLLSYVMINLAWSKYEEMVEEIQSLWTSHPNGKANLQKGGNGNKGKNSLDIKIDKKIDEWKNM